MKHIGTVTIETPRLTLRQFVPEDADAMYRNWASDPEVTKFLTWPAYTSPKDAQAKILEWIQQYEKKDHYLWAIVYKDQDNEPIGSISVNEYDERVKKAEIGYCIGRKWWHQGIMAEALQAVIDLLMGEVGFNRIEAEHDVNNPNSGAVMRKCGMTLEGTLRAYLWNNQGVCDTKIYSILRDEWKGRSAWKSTNT